MARIAERIDPLTSTVNKQNRTAFGPRRSAFPPGTASGMQGVVSIETGDGANNPAVLTMDATSPVDGSVTTWYLWVSSTGVLRISSTFPVTELTDGSSVGSQT